MAKIILHPGDNRSAMRKNTERLLGQLPDELFSILVSNEYRDYSLLYDPKDEAFHCFDESVIKSKLPDISNDPNLKVLIKNVDRINESDHGTICISIPFKVLQNKCYDNWVYRITFSPGSDSAKEILDHESFSAFRNKHGYIGVTSRQNPLARFHEHIAKAKSGNGFLLHKAWNSLMGVTDVMVQFSIVGSLETRHAAFDVEEDLVDRYTLAPMGLNAIAGGMKGIRELWKLGLLGKHDKPTDARRDAALELLETDRSPVASHYRTGHIRRLSARCKMETTWVSPCWVGLNREFADA